MTDEKQIEELNDFISEEYNNGNDNWYSIAEGIYALNYRKLPPKAVVMTNEDYNRLFTRARQGGIKVLDFESIRKAEERTRKETAREIITEMIEFAERSLKIYGCIEEVDFEVLCNELANKCGVEVKE